MTSLALDSGGVPRVTEKDEIRQAHAARGSKRRRVRRLLEEASDEGTVRKHDAVTAQTLGYGRKPGALGLPRSGVACDAAKF
jgi:ssDNA-binding replication factor A large subunit